MSKLWKDFKRIIKSHYKINVRSFNDTYYGDDRYIRTKYNFTIDEVPNWLFGLWFTNNINTYAFFAQYEDNINKFKPTQSTLLATGKYIKNSYSNFNKALELITFIQHNNAKAFYMDDHFKKYINPQVDVDEYYNDFLKHQELERELIPQYDNKILNVISEYMSTQEPNISWFIMYRDDNYWIYAHDAELKKPGTYMFWDEKVGFYVDKLRLECYNDAVSNQITYFCLIDNCASFCSLKDFKHKYWKNKKYIKAKGGELCR